VPRKYLVEIAKAAQRDVSEIHAHIAADAAAARRWRTEVRRQIASLEQFSLRAPLIPEAADLGVSYRQLLHGQYRTIFRVEDDLVILVRVIHGARLLSLPDDR
jgi:plasmid stabilization system protein ParE